MGAWQRQARPAPPAVVLHARFRRSGRRQYRLDGAASWSTLLNQPTAQFYHVTTDDHVPYHVYGPQQDNWAMRLPSAETEGAISWKDYVEPGGGESGYIAISKRPPHLVFGGGI